jgi:branched-chain amino acid transport system substrate-binding protein
MDAYRRTSGIREELMRKIISALAAGLAVVLAAPGAKAQGTVKVGLIMPFSGQFADAATQMDNAIRLWLKQNGETVAGRKLEIIRKDTGGIAPDVAKRLAQELVVRDNVDILAGFVLTPNAMAAGDVSQQAKKFMVVMNAATSIITTKSEFMVRTSLTTPQLNAALGEWAVKKSGVKKVYSMVSDFGPGLDAEAAFVKAFREAGGEVVGQVKFPVANPDFSAFVQRARDLNPESIYIWVPGGAQPGAVGKALAERGIDARKTKVLGQLELTDPGAIKAMGDAALGIIVASHYDSYHESAANKRFVDAFRADYKRDPDYFSIGGWDGMHLIGEVLKKTGGKTDAAVMIAAAKGMKWESPRGPISIDPETRDIIQNVYIRQVQKIGAENRNVQIDVIPNVKDPVKAAMKK